MSNTSQEKTSSKRISTYKRESDNFREFWGIFLGIFFGNSLEIIWKFFENSLGILLNSLVTVWNFWGIPSENSFGIIWNFWEFLWNSCGILVEFFGNSLEILWECMFLGVLNVWVLILGNFDLKWCNFWLKGRQGQIKSLEALLRDRT